MANAMQCNGMILMGWGTDGGESLYMTDIYIITYKRSAQPKGLV